MKKREGIFIILVLIMLVIGVGIYIVIKNKNEIEEYIPQEEISEEQVRQTIVTLYFKNKENGEISAEPRKTDVSLLMKDPYNYLLTELINGPKNEKLERIIPIDVKLNGTRLEKDVLIVDLSKEFLLNAPSDEQEQIKILKSIVNTVTELTEVNSIKLLIDGEEGRGFENNNIMFNENINRII